MSPICVQQQTPSCLSTADTRNLPAGATLPVALVRRIIGYLPLSMHGQCALVCRSWQALVPGTRQTLAHWRQQLSPLQRHSCRHLAAGYQDRIRPWLRSLGSPWFPAVERQHQELQRLHHALAGQSAPEQRPQVLRDLASAQHCFAALVHYSLHQSLITRGPHSLQRVPALDGPVCLAAFSGCSRWLAMTQKKARGQEQAFLRLYGWHQGLWQPEPLLDNPACPVVAQSVDRMVFSDAQPDRLISAQSNGQLVSWQRQPATGAWQPTPLVHTDDKICQIMANSDGDLFLQLRSRDETCCRRRLLIFHDSAAGGIRCLVSRDYSSLQAIVTGPCHQQVALATPLTTSDPGCVMVHIWQRAPGKASPAPWDWVQTPLDKDRKVLLLAYSPDGRHLLALLAGARAGLWFIAQDRSLQPRLDVACSCDAIDQVGRLLRPFHNSGQQLVLASSAHRLQFYEQRSDGLWQQGQSLDTAELAGNLADEQPLFVQWSADGQCLVQVTSHRLRLWWHKGADGWQQWLCRTVEDHKAPPPGAWLLPPFFNLCVTSVFREGQLSIYGTGSEGPPEKRGCTTWGFHMVCCEGSPDGLSLAFASALSTRLHLLQWAAPAVTGPTPGAVVPDHRHVSDALPEGAPLPDQDNRQARLLSDEAVIPLDPDRLAPAARLPRELLQWIFGQLSLSDHGCCALVCRHWYASLPGFRGRLAHWLAARTGSQRAACRFLGLGYSRTIRPWLQAWHSSLLPPLERQHRACQHQASARPQLSALLHYSLHQQVMHIGSDQLSLHRLAVRHPGQNVFFRADMSGCSRWIAACHQPDGGRGRLQIYSLREGSWQQERLQPPLEVPASDYRFSPVAPETLFSVHGADLVAWRRAEDSGDWHRTQLWNSPHLHNIGDLITFACGDMMIGCWPEDDRGVLRLFVFQAPEKIGTCKAPAEHIYSQHVYGLAWSWAGNQLAVAQGFASTGLFKHQVHIWHRIANKGKAMGWWCTTSAIRSRHAVFVDMVYSVDDRYLQVLFSWGRLSLFTLDAQYRLQEQLALCCYAPQGTVPFYALVDFSQDGQRCAVAYARDKVQLWNRDSTDHWAPGVLITNPSEPEAAAAADAEDELCSVELSADGRALLCGTLRSFSIWQQDDPGWQRLVHLRAPADARFLFSSGDHKTGPCPLFCVAASDPQGSLWLYGPDVRGQIIRKAATSLGAPVAGFGCSADGLSLLVALDDADIVVQLGGPVAAAMEEPNR